jgi:hypothetical protein
MVNIFSVAALPDSARRKRADGRIEIGERVISKSPSCESEEQVN